MIALTGRNLVAMHHRFGYILLKQQQQTRWSTSKSIRLQKRMGELDICSRREGDRLIRAGKIYVNGEVAVLGQNVSSQLQKEDITIINDDVDKEEESTVRAVVLNKPAGYVSGQEEHGHLPAIRLLRRDNLWSNGGDDDGGVLPSSWRGFAPAGRLDLFSTGLLVFCSSGVIAKKIIHHESILEKEYVVDVEAAVQATRRELEIDPSFSLPKPTFRLNLLQEGGRLLLGDDRPLKPFPDASWLQKGKQLRLVLREGRKHHIRRACREILGLHVVRLQRIRIGPILLGDLPEGFWRPLTEQELKELLS